MKYPQLVGQANMPVTKNTGVFSWFLVNHGWAEAAVGPYIAPRPWIEIDLGAAIEIGQSRTRLYESLWLGHKRGSLLWVNEKGEVDYWYLVEGNYYLLQSTTSFGIGLRAQRTVGIGPRFEVKHAEWKLSA